MSTAPFENPPLDLQPMDLMHAQTTGHLESCDFCVAQEALTFAELLDYSRADVPGLGYFIDYYSVDHISAARVEAIRECILALCTSESICRGCGEAVPEGNDGSECGREVKSLIAGRAFESPELPELSKKVWAWLGFVLVFFELSTILTMWP